MIIKIYGAVKDTKVLVVVKQKSFMFRSIEEVHVTQAP